MRIVLNTTSEATFNTNEFLTQLIIQIEKTLNMSFGDVAELVEKEVETTKDTDNIFHTIQVNLEGDYFQDSKQKAIRFEQDYNRIGVTLNEFYENNRDTKEVRNIKSITFKSNAFVDKNSYMAVTLQTKDADTMLSYIRFNDSIGGKDFSTGYIPFEKFNDDSKRVISRYTGNVMYTKIVFED